MKAILLFCIFTYVSAAYVNVSNLWLRRASEVAEECQKAWNVDGKRLLDVFRRKVEAENEDEKCIMMCIMDKFNLLKNGKLDVEATKQLHSWKYKDPAKIERANRVTDICKDTTGENECDLGYNIMKCLLDETDKITSQ